MKNLIMTLVLAVFVSLSFGFISQGGSDEQVKKTCPFLEKIKSHTDCPYLSGEKSAQGSCPFLSGEKSGCPFMKGEVKEKDSGQCPYSGSKENRKSIEGQKVKQLKVKYS